MLKYAFTRWKPPAEPFGDNVDMHRWQRGRCAICGRKPHETYERLQIDHDHETGLVRGYLCRDCNADEWPYIWRGPNGYLEWQTGLTPAGKYGLVQLYRSIVRGPIFEAPTQEYVDAIFAWSNLDASGYRITYRETPEPERYRALGYVLAGVRAIHEERRTEDAQRLAS